MNFDYLYSIFRLYLNKEKDTKRTVLNIKKIEDNVEFSFSMKNANEDKTTFVIPYLDYSNQITNLLDMYKNNLLVIDEKYNYYKGNRECSYYVLFNSGREISFDGFSVLEMNNIRNMLYGIDINQEEIRLEKDEEKEMAYKPRLRLQQAGFSSYASLFMVALMFIAVLFIALFVFKSILN